MAVLSNYMFYGLGKTFKKDALKEFSALYAKRMSYKLDQHGDYYIDSQGNEVADIYCMEDMWYGKAQTLVYNWNEKHKTWLIDEFIGGQEDYWNTFGIGFLLPLPNIYGNSFVSFHSFDPDTIPENVMKEFFDLCKDIGFIDSELQMNYCAIAMCG